jgi:hypothetical protein
LLEDRLNLVKERSRRGPVAPTCRFQHIETYIAAGGTPALAEEDVRRVTADPTGGRPRNALSCAPGGDGHS